MNKLFIAFVVTIYVCFANASGEGFGAELGNLDFRNIFGGPMVAVVHAQALAAATTTQFITEMGFTYNEEENIFVVRTVSFEYDRVEDNGTVVSYTLTVPFIMLIPIPYIEINILSIDLNVKLTSVDTTESSTNFNSYAEVGVGASWFGNSVNFKGGFSYKSNSKQTGSTSRDYSLDIHVQCGQSGLPKGTERILDMLESIIVESLDA